MPRTNTRNHNSEGGILTQDKVEKSRTCSILVLRENSNIIAMRICFKRIIEILKVIQYLLTGKANRGYCSICEKPTLFIEYGPWLRDQYRCILCNSIPRNRALINVLNSTYPNWQSLAIHESSPGNPASDYLAKKCTNCSFSLYHEDLKPGSYINGIRCENLEHMTFPDETFDLFITQDVFEHIFNPEKAFKEIARVLRPEGAHIFTVPWYPMLKESTQRAREVDGKIVFIEEPVYHGNPIDKKGSLVTRDWGLDLLDVIYEASKLITAIYSIEDRRMGLDAEFLEVFVSRKAH